MASEDSRKRVSERSVRHHRPWRIRKGILAPPVAATLALLAGAALARQEPPAPTEAPDAPAAPAVDDGPAYSISAFELRYLRENPLHPPLEQIMTTEILLAQIDAVFVAPREDRPTVTVTLAQLSDGQVRTFYASAVQRILETLRDDLVARDLLGIYVAPEPRQINEIGQDLRAEGDTQLVILITTGIVTEMRTLGSGERVGEKSEIKPEDRVNNPLHASILERSPFNPYEEGDEQREDLLRKDKLDRYLFHLGRHPGRRVDATVAAAADIGGIALDYLVTENRPLVIYAQLSNTGTRPTDYWRQRFGFFHTQLTNNDDILSLDYTTAKFDNVHALIGSYEAPFPNDRLRWRVQGTWSEYSASDIGFFNEVFTGESWSVDGQIVANIYQDRELFLDLLGGVRFEDQHVENEFFEIIGDEDFIIPYVGLRLDRTTEWFSTQGTLTCEFQDGSLNDLRQSELTRLGRTLPDENWAILRWDLSHSVYLEPLLDREAWEDPSTPETSTLAHELAFALRGQHAFSNRVIPQAEYVIGGLYSVRGYPQSVVASDTAIVGSVEYRYHVPRAFTVQPEPREMFGEPFRAAPQYVYGQPDWDLILKGFFDVGHTIISNPLWFEEEQTLIGAGVGVEFLWKRNLNVRLDWGFALDDLEGAGVHSGANRLHLVATILF